MNFRRVSVQQDRPDIQVCLVEFLRPIQKNLHNAHVQDHLRVMIHT